MGSAFKNILLSLSFCAFVVLLSPGFDAIDTPLSIITPWLGVAVSLVQLGLGIASVGLFIFFLVKTGIAMTDLKRQFPEEKVSSAGTNMFFLLLFFILEFPTLLNKRDRILRKHDQFQPFISPTLYTIIVSSCVVLSLVCIGAIGLNTYQNASNTVKRVAVTNKKTTAEKPSNTNSENTVVITNTNTETTPSTTTAATQTTKYNDCFYLVKTSATCQYKTSHPLSGYDPDQDGLITYWEANQYNTDSGKADTDGDGTPDGLEISLHTDPLSAETTKITSTVFKYDVDADGVFDELEKSLGLDHGKTDTDGDDYNDGEEIYSGYDPLGPGKMTYTYDTTADWVSATGYHQ